MLSIKHILLIFATLFVCQISYAEHRESGSSDYKNAKKIYDLLYTVNEENRDKAIKSADSLINAGTKIDDYQISCLGYSLKARILYVKEQIESSLVEIAKWKNLALKHNDYEEYFTAYYSYCNYLQDINSAKALLQGQKMITEAKQLKYMPGLAMAHEMQGNLSLYILQDYPTATYHFKSAIDIAKKLHNVGPDLGRLYFKVASSLGEEHKYTESEENLKNVKKFYGKNIPSDKEFRILIIQLDNAYNQKVDAKTFDKLYQKVINNEQFGANFGSDTQLFYKIRWLIRTNHEQEALKEIPNLSIALDRSMLKCDAYASLGDWKRASILKDSIELAKDSMMRDLHSEELIEIDAEMKNTELSIESTESKARFHYVLLSSITLLCVIALVIAAYYLYQRHKRKLEKDRALFVHNVTHQLRTPMTVVTGMVEQLKDHIPATDTVGLKNLEATKRQSRKLQGLIMQLARMSKTNITPLINAQGDLSVAPVVATTPMENKETPTLATDTSKPSILLAEDTNDVAMMMCNLLKDNGYIVTRAVDGKEAMDILQHDLPDLLITDVAMPRMDGLELMRSIRKDATMCHLPIIVASARVEDSERLEGISAGAEVYLTKPFIPEELLLRVSTMLKQRELIRRSFSHIDAEQKEKVIAPQMTEEERTFMDAIDKCINDNMKSREFNANSIADIMCTSLSTINRKVKNISGMPISTYIRTRRVLQAKIMLRTTNKTITDIEITCGFSTPGHFSRIFKTETGMSPSEYRQQKGNNI